MIIRYTVYILHYIKYLHGGCLSTGRWYRRHYTHTSLWRRVPFYTIHQKLHAPLAHGLSSTDLHDGNDVGHGGLTSTSDYVGGDSSGCLFVGIFIGLSSDFDWWYTSIFTYRHIVIESATVSLYDDKNSHGRHRGFTKSMLFLEIIIAKLYDSS